MAQPMPRIVAAIHNAAGWTVILCENGPAHAYREKDADRFAANRHQRIIRNPDWSCTIEDLPKPKTALELLTELTDEAQRWGVFEIAKLQAALDAILEGRAS